jgi:putative ATP-dependent endonuclease of OLD family
MKILKVEVENFRLLKKFAIDLEDELSLVIGKNNTGKTSLLSVLDKFLNSGERNRFTFDDFNLDFKNNLRLLVESATADLDSFEELGIKMTLFIEYSETDDLTNVSKVMMDLDPENNSIVLGFGCILNAENFLLLREDYKTFAANERDKKETNSDYEIRDLNYFLDRYHLNYFEISKKSLQYDKESGNYIKSKWIDLDKEKISLKELINFKFISARREVTNKDIDKTLSGQTSKIYKKSEATSEQNKAIEEFKDKLSETDSDLSEIYSSLFETVIKKVRDFGGMKQNESVIRIISTLQHRELLEGNTTVVYSHDEHNHLPEHYNGLGYMNLISMIFEIEILIHEFKKNKHELPADINLLFIEEPEAHTHPQMQYVFIKNIKNLLKEGVLREDGIHRKLQYIISTHSSHIVADSEFDDIKYLKKSENNGVVARNLKELEYEYAKDGEEESFRFLRQYLTLIRAELFFADKAIFIEGDTERILLPAMMRKMDNQFPTNPLLSQNISIVEVGNYANVFEKFIKFIEVKSLIVTDLDSVHKRGVRNDDGTTKKIGILKDKEKMAYYSCRVCQAEKTSNPALKFFFKDMDFDALKVLDFDNKRFKKESNWVVDVNGYLQIVFQTEEFSYQARSFEDAFFNIPQNVDFIKKNRSRFKGLKNMSLFYDSTKDCFDRAEKCIDSKGTFAVDILLFSSYNQFQDWEIPAYIKEGLLWLKQD